MEFSVKIGQAEKKRAGCAIVGIYEGDRLTPAAEAFDKAGGGLIRGVLEGGDLKDKPGQTLLVQRPAGLQVDRLLLVRCGKPQATAEEAYRKIVKGAAGALTATSARNALCCLHELPVEGHDLGWKVRQMVEATGQAAYRFVQLKSEKENNKGRPALAKLSFLVASKQEVTACEEATRHAQAILAGMNLAKDLGNLPGNICTPTYLANQAKELGRRRGIKVTVLDEKAMKELGMGALLGVAKGSREPARLITLEYQGGKAGKKQKPVVLVGKGVTFDAGGISLKPPANMDEMKYDMCGAAAVLGTLEAVASLDLPLRVIGVIPSSENLPDGQANKPGDILTSLSGQTIEVLNTDAEGRLLLCDALTYSERFDPEVVVDIATLTGACVIALGRHASGLLSNDDELAHALLAAGRRSGDRGWQLPLWEDYQEQLKSNFADMANVGGKEAGTITAACFLSRFTRKFRWAHIDIAGTAWTTGSEKGATGRPVPLLTQYLLDRVAQMSD